LPFTVDFEYLPRGIRIRGQFYPLLKMKWVDGFLLNEFVRDNLDKPKKLEALSAVWLRMAKGLRAADIAHADLQHGNVLLAQGRKEGSLALKLIDYDGMWVPALADKQSGEVGHPAYQHPQRLQRGVYSAEVDRLPVLVIACAMRALTARGRMLWDKHDNGDNLLFREADLRAPAQSVLLKELWNRTDAATHDMTGWLVLGLAGPIELSPLLSNVLFDDRPRPLTADQERCVARILGEPDRSARAILDWAMPVAAPLSMQSPAEQPQPKSADTHIQPPSLPWERAPIPSSLSPASAWKLDEQQTAQPAPTPVVNRARGAVTAAALSGPLLVGWFGLLYLFLGATVPLAVLAPIALGLTVFSVGICLLCANRLLRPEHERKVPANRIRAWALILGSNGAALAILAVAIEILFVGRGPGSRHKAAPVAQKAAADKAIDPVKDGIDEPEDKPVVPPLLAPVVENRPTVLPELHIVAVIDGTDTVRISQHRGLWTHGDWQWPPLVRINNLAWNLKGNPSFDQVGTSNLFAEKIEFSTAKLTVKKARGKVELKTARDYIEIHFDDGPPGSDIYELLVSFQKAESGVGEAGDIADILKDLSDTAPTVRVSALRELNKRRPDAHLVFEELWKCMEANEAQVFAEARLTLEAVGPPAKDLDLCRRVLAQGLRLKEPKAREFAIQTLTLLVDRLPVGQRATLQTTLVPALRDDLLDLANQAARALDKMRPVNEDVRPELEKACASRHSEIGVYALTTLIKDAATNEARVGAIEAAVKNGRGALVSTVIRDWKKLGDDGVPLLLLALRHPDRGIAQEAVNASQAERLGAEWMTELREVQKSQHDVVRLHVMRLLDWTKLELENALDIMQPALRDPDAKVKKLAVSTLALQLSNANDDARLTAFACLEALQKDIPKVDQVFATGLDSSDATIRQKSAAALAKYPDTARKSVDKLRNMLSLGDGDALVAVKTLVDLDQSQEVLKELEAQSNNKTWIATCRAILGLPKTKELNDLLDRALTPKLELLEKTGDVRAEAVRALAQLGPDIVSKLVPMLDPKYKRLSKSAGAALVLKEIGPRVRESSDAKKAEESLEIFRQEGGPQWAEVAQGALQAIRGTLPVPKTVPAVKRPPHSETPPAAKKPKDPKVIQVGTLISDRLTATDPKDMLLTQSSSKVYQVTLTRGRTYIIGMASNDFDTYLRLEDADGLQLAANDDDGIGLNSRIVFRPDTSGPYRVIATSFRGRHGSFTLLVR
jgi:hypothetical protein